MVKQLLKNLVRRLRIARYERQQTNRDLQDMAHAEHLERAREGIKDNLPQGPPF